VCVVEFEPDFERAGCLVDKARLREVKNLSCLNPECPWCLRPSSPSPWNLPGLADDEDSDPDDDEPEVERTSGPLPKRRTRTTGRKK